MKHDSRNAGADLSVTNETLFSTSGIDLEMIPPCDLLPMHEKAMRTFCLAIKLVTADRAARGDSNEMMAFAGAWLLSKATAGKDLDLVYAALLYEDGAAELPTTTGGKLLCFSSLIARLNMAMQKESNGDERAALSKLASDISVCFAIPYRGLNTYLDEEFRLVQDHILGALHFETRHN